MKTFQVLNVKCGGCANTLKNKLEPIFGKIDVNLDVMPREITIYNDDVNIDELREKLKSLGYPMADEDLNLMQELGTKAKSFVSCAIGKAGS